MLGMYGKKDLKAKLRYVMRREREPTETEEERQKRLAKAEIERYKAQGLKEFKYGGNRLYALNQSVADKKAKKRGWL